MTACFQGSWLVVAMGSPTACGSNLERLTAQVKVKTQGSCHLPFLYLNRNK